MLRVSPLAIAMFVAMPAAFVTSAACSARIGNDASIDDAGESSSLDGGCLPGQLRDDR